VVLMPHKPVTLAGHPGLLHSLDTRTHLVTRSTCTTFMKAKFISVLFTDAALVDCSAEQFAVFRTMQQARGKRGLLVPVLDVALCLRCSANQQSSYLLCLRLRNVRDIERSYNVRRRSFNFLSPTPAK